MGKGSKQKVEITEYHLSVHVGVCSGPVDAVKQIYVGEKEAWSGNVTANGSEIIDNKKLFGGQTEEGGLAGRVHFLLGGVGQTLSDFLAGKLGRTSATCPGFRGLTSLFFVGVETPEEAAGPVFQNHAKGFYWSANSPYLKSIWAKVTRAPKGLAADKAMIGDDANPAHLLYECLTNTDWGMGAPVNLLDVDSFERCGDTLYDEGLGVSMIWTRQAPIEEFVNDVLAHIEGLMYVDPATGLITLSLTRFDYNPDDLPVFTPANCRVTSFQRKALGEMINEINVTWTNPANEQEETVTLQDLASISMQGVVTDNRNYYGFRNRETAMKVAARDLRVASAPLASLEIEFNREAWDLRPGSVVKLTYPEYEIENMVIRLGQMDYGASTVPVIKASAVEDIFSFMPADTVTPPGTSWVDTSEQPANVDNATVFTLPYYMTELVLGAQAASTLEYPEVLSGYLVSRDSQDTWDYNLFLEQPTLSGDLQFNDMGAKNLAGRSTLSQALDPAEAESIVDFGNAIVGRGPSVNGFVFIGAGADSTGDGVDEEMEIALVTGEATDGFVLRRGVLDTIPQAWPIGTPVWFVDPDTSTIYEETVLSAGEDISTKFLTNTSLGQLALADATTYVSRLTDRPYLPIRPADVKVDGEPLEVEPYAGPGPYNVTWANRNRLQEGTPLLSWTDATVAGEVGQTTTVELLDMDGNVIHTYSGVAGTSHAVDRADFAGAPEGQVRVTSERDGFRSLTGWTVLVRGIPTNETVAVVAAMTVPPSAARANLIDRTIRGLIDAGVWAKLDRLYVLAGHTEQASRVDWKTAANALAASNSPTFTVDRGFTGDGATSYLDSLWTPDGSSQFQQNSAHGGYWSLSHPGGSGQGDFGRFGSPGSFYFAPSGTVQQYRSNDLTTQTNALGAGLIPGYHWMSRISASAYRTGKDGAFIAEKAISSTGVPSSSFRILHIGNIYSASQIALAHWGSALSDTEASDAYTIFRNYLQEVGAI